MIKTSLLRAGVAGAFALALAPIALANTQAMPPNADRAVQKETAALKESKVALPQAIAAAEQKENGKALSARLDLRDQKPVYRVRLLEKDRIAAARVDAVTGQVVESGKARAAGQWTAREKQEVATLRHDSFTLDAAVALAQKHMTGTPVSARLADNHKTLGYEVAFLGNDGRIQKLMLGPDNRTMAQNTQQ
jgi:uncharacterized membrane protein YkoI